MSKGIWIAVYEKIENMEMANPIILANLNFFIKTTIKMENKVK